MKSGKKIVLRCLIISMLLIIVAYIGLGFYFTNAFLPNTFVNGIKCDWKSVSEVNSLLSQQGEIPQIVVYDEDEEPHTLDMAAAGFKLDYSKGLKKTVQGQNIVLWLLNAFDSKNYQLEADGVYTDDTLKKAWDDLDLVQERKNSDGTYEIIKTKEGFELNENMSHRLNLDNAYDYIKDQLNGKNFEIHLKDGNSYVEEELTDDQAANKEIWDELNKFWECNIVYDMGTEQIEFDQKILSGFLKCKNNVPVLENGTLVVDENKIEAFVDDLCDQYDTLGKDREFMSTRGDLITITNVTYGTKLDRDAEVEFLKEALQDPSCFGTGKTEHIPTYESEPFVRGLDDLGNTYIEIDMTNQKMYYYIDGELFVETDVVTGCTSKKHGTPSGVNKVYAKQKNRTLRGADYAAFVSYWMPVKGNIGIHDSSWRGKYGGEIYKRSGSHGCINTPKKAMKEIFNNTELGTPVLTFY